MPSQDFLKEPEIKEALADLIHEQWSGWMKHMWGKGTKNADGTLTIPAWAVKRWERQMAASYAELPEAEKDSDRSEADRILARFKDHLPPSMDDRYAALAQQIRSLVVTWAKTMGLGWWEIDVYYYDDPAEVARTFREADSAVSGRVAAQVDADWRYMCATIEFNLLAFINMKPDKIEACVVHELVHIFLQEMQMDGDEYMCHVEHVTTLLTRAFIWVRDREHQAAQGAFK